MTLGAAIVVNHEKIDKYLLLSLVRAVLRLPPAGVVISHKGAWRPFSPVVLNPFSLMGQCSSEDILRIDKELQEFFFPSFYQDSKNKTK